VSKARPGILAVGLHPAIDRTIELPELRRASVLRGRLLRVEAGGKTANIIHTLSNFGHRVAATGFLGRDDAPFFLRTFDPINVKREFVLADSPTRENVTLIEKKSGCDIHILAGALSVRREDVARLEGIVKRLATGMDWAIFSGSRPNGMTLADYRSLLRVCGERAGRLVVDASGSMLRAALRERPWLIKPNRDELAELVGRRLRSYREVVRAASSLLTKCENVLVSLGKAGAVLVCPDGAWRAREARPPKPAMTVGCGDALLAGFVSACVDGATLRDALRFGTACGSACARTDYASLRSTEQPSALLQRVSLTGI
jgi:1-phosphofructokinase family hexose kinase